jgi:hypothetical protein
VSARRGSVLVTTAIRVLASLLAAGVTEVAAQTQPATIPTAVAQAMSFEPSVFGRPQFFDAQTPTDWPAALVPPGAKVLGGGIVGDGTMLRMSVAVFEFSGQSNPRAVLEAVVAKAGFGSPAPPPPASPTGGFAETAAPTSAGKYCKGSTLVAFVPVDSVRAPRVFAVSLVDGEAGRQNCSVRAGARTDRRFPVTVPTLVPPAGVLSFGGGSSWSDDNGQMTWTLRTTMPTDSILAHYSAELVAGGWRAEGKAANADGIGVQRFSFREGQDAWTAALIVLAAGDRRHVLLQLSRSE